MPIYTRTGDRGTTGLFGNERVPKDDLRIEAYGTVDEVNALLGLLRAEEVDADWDRQLATIQDTLFELGADLATPGLDAASPRVVEAAGTLEGWIDASESELPPLRSFVLPAGHRQAALCHLLRTVVRRAERVFWQVQRRDELPPAAGVYLNRLSDLLFSWARRCNLRHGVADVPWQSAGR